MTRFWDNFCRVIEILLAILYIQGGVRILTAQPLLAEGIVGYLTNQVAIYTYGVLCLFLGGLLLYSKWKNFRHLNGRKNKLHKYALMGMFVIATYVLILSVWLEGLKPGHTLNIVVVIATAAMWLVWKLRTEYHPPSYFESKGNHERRPEPN